jgi:heme/copper-type cytochrome/quinol oxidase subunit 2
MEIMQNGHTIMYVILAFVHWMITAISFYAHFKCTRERERERERERQRERERKRESNCKNIKLIVVGCIITI